MDLEGFVAPVQTPSSLPSSLSFEKALKLLDNVWFIGATRSARWMDLLGDYAGSEPFVIDGDALLQIVLDDPLLSIGREDSKFQILHAYFSLERILIDFQQRSANFEIVFWQRQRHLSIGTGKTSFATASRALARSMLFRHLQDLPFKIHVFEDIKDPLWVGYVSANKPMFIMTNDGGLIGKNSPDELEAAAVFAQRTFLLEILAGPTGIAVTLLRGAEYRDSKILTFVYEPAQKALPLAKLLQPLSTVAHDRLQKHWFSELSSKGYSLQASGRLSKRYNDLALFFSEVKIMSAIQRGVPPEVVFLFIAHTILLPDLSVDERARVSQPLSPDLIECLVKDFLPSVFSHAADYLASCCHSVQVDGTIFLTLIAFIISKNSEVASSLGPVLFSEAQRLWSVLDGPPLDFEVFTKKYPLPRLEQSGATSRTSKPLELLRFSNRIFDEAFSVLGIPDEIGDDQVPPGKYFFDLGSAVQDTHHWHNANSILPAHMGGSKRKAEDPRARFRRLRSDQRFMNLLQRQAASLTGASGASLQQITIAPVGSPKTPKERPAFSKLVPQRKKKAPVLSSADKLRLKIKEEKEARQADASEERWKKYLSTTSKFSISQKAASLADSFRNRRLITPIIIRLYSMNLELQTWIEDADRSSDIGQDRYTISIMRTFQEILKANVLTLSAKKALTTVLQSLGFYDYLAKAMTTVQLLESEDRRLRFSFVKLLDPN